MPTHRILTLTPVPGSLKKTRHWLYPGAIAVVAPGLYMGLRHNRLDNGHYQVTCNFLTTQGDRPRHRIRGMLPINYMISLQQLCNRVIVIRAQKLDATGRPTRTLVEVHTIKQSQKLTA